MLPSARRRILLLLLAVIAAIWCWLKQRRKRLTLQLAAQEQPRPLEQAPSEQPLIEPTVDPPVGAAPARRTDGGFAAFLSHYKVEAATEARWLQGELEAYLDERCFLVIST